MKKDFGLAAVKVSGKRPIAGLVRSAERGRADGFDEVWCVLDHDEREPEIKKFREWLRAQKTGCRIEEVLSIPCFEYWLLIHFENITRPFRGLDGRSACQQVIKMLKKHLPDYRKNDSRTYLKCREHLNTALARARRPSAARTHSSTNVWKLVERLQDAKKAMEPAE